MVVLVLVLISRGVVVGGGGVLRFFPGLLWTLRRLLWRARAFHVVRGRRALQLREYCSSSVNCTAVVTAEVLV